MSFLYLAIVLMLTVTTAAQARDYGQWEDTDPEIRQWYRSLIQPDNAPVSCCGEADSYFCSEHSSGPQIYCIIEDDRDNVKLRRAPVPNGTKVYIPHNKLNRDSNPIGRSIVFMSSGGFVYCFISAGGV